MVVPTQPQPQLTTTTCASPGCENSTAETKLACPKCISLGLPPVYFCSQQCFKDNYASHKQVHVKSTTKKLNNNGSSNGPTTATTQQQAPVQHRKIPPRNGVSCLPNVDDSIKQQLPDWAVSYNFTGTLRPCLYSPQMLIDRNQYPQIRQPDYASHPQGVSISEQRDKSSYSSLVVYTEKELKEKDDPTGLRHACYMGRQVLDIAGRALRMGVTTDEIDRIVYDACIERNLYPSPLNYYNFPKSLCTSVNEVICHGIPDYRPIEDGDIINLDISVYNQGGYHADLNETYCIGNVDTAGQELVQTSFECLAAASRMIQPGTLYRDLGTVIEKTAKSRGNYSVVRTYCGHGIGTLFHTSPNIPHYAKNKAKGVMKAGHVFTIEPMINESRNPNDVTWGDNWTAVTVDGKRSSQFEHTFLVTDTGYEILTARDNEPVMIWNAELNQR